MDFLPFSCYRLSLSPNVYLYVREVLGEGRGEEDLDRVDIQLEILSFIVLILFFLVFSSCPLFFSLPVLRIAFSP